MQGKERYHLKNIGYTSGGLNMYYRTTPPLHLNLKKLEESEIYSVSKYGHLNLLFQFQRKHFFIIILEIK